MNITVILLSVACLILGAGASFVIVRVLGKKAEVRTLRSSITERIRAVGKLTGLEVMSKEIVTQTKGLNWLPPLLLSQARLAMIFHFEKQYFVDLSRLESHAVERVSGNQFVIELPSIEGNLNLIEVIPYDIQSGKLLGLLDVFKMDAEAQGKMMQQAQVEAGKLYEENAARYESEARRAVARQVHGLLELFDVDVEVRFKDDANGDDGGTQVRGVAILNDYQKNGEKMATSDENNVSKTTSHQSKEGRGGMVKKKRGRFFSRRKTPAEV